MKALLLKKVPLGLITEFFSDIFGSLLRLLVGKFRFSIKFAMICSVKQPGITIASSDALFRRKHAHPVPQWAVLPSLPREKIQKSLVSVLKPLHISSTGSFRSVNSQRNLITCKAYEADRSEPIESKIETKSEAAKKVKIGIYFATWWALNVVFNIYNKKVLNVYPYPWLTSTLSLACGSLMMLISWATRIAEAPKTDFEFWKTLFPVSMWVLFVTWEN